MILTGFSPFSLSYYSSQVIDQFQFTACVDIKTSEVEYMHKYPKELYGSESNWEGGIATLVFPELTPSGEIIHSFPVSHYLYIAPWNSNTYKTVYGGSNFVSTIRSFDWEPRARVPREKETLANVETDFYLAIRYDPYRKLYYRVIWQGINDIDLEKKTIKVIIMDEQFNYMGETVIGTWKQWNWSNIFVTREGLNIEFISDNYELDEDFMIFKTFSVEKIDK